MSVVTIHLERSTDGGTNWGAYAGFPGATTSITIDNTGQTDWEIPPNLDPSHKWRLVSKKSDGTIISTAEFDVKSKSEIIFIDDNNNSLSASKINILNFGDTIRFACGQDDEPAIYQIIDRDYFWGNEVSQQYLINDIADNMQISSDVFVTLEDSDTTAKIKFQPYLPISGSNTTLFSGLEHPERFVLKGIDKVYIDGVLIDDSNDQFSYSTENLGTADAQLILRASYGTFAGQDIELEYNVSPIKGYNDFHFDSPAYPSQAETTNSFTISNTSITSKEDVDGTIVIDSNGFQLASNTYYYKFVPVYDGNQEAPMTDEPQFETSAVNTDESTYKRYIEMKFDISYLNPRITSINVYRSLSAGGPYYLISTISTLGRLKDPNVIGFENTLTGNVAYIPQSDTTMAEDSNSILCINGKVYTCEALTDNDGVKKEVYKLTGLNKSLSASGYDDVPPSPVEKEATPEDTGWFTFNNANYILKDAVVKDSRGVWGANSKDSYYVIHDNNTGEYDKCDDTGKPPLHTSQYPTIRGIRVSDRLYGHSQAGMGGNSFDETNREEHAPKLSKQMQLPHKEGGYMFLKKDTAVYQDFTNVTGKNMTYPYSTDMTSGNYTDTANKLHRVLSQQSTASWGHPSHTSQCQNTGDLLFEQMLQMYGRYHRHQVQSGTTPAGNSILFDPTDFSTEPGAVVGTQEIPSSFLKEGPLKDLNPFESYFHSFINATDLSLIEADDDIVTPGEYTDLDINGYDASKRHWLLGTKVNKEIMDGATKTSGSPYGGLDPCVLKIKLYNWESLIANSPSTERNLYVRQPWVAMPFGHTYTKLVDTTGDGTADSYYDPHEDFHRNGNGGGATFDTPTSTNWEDYSFIPSDSTAIRKLDPNKTYYIGMWVKVSIPTASMTDGDGYVPQINQGSNINMSIRSHPANGGGSLYHTISDDLNDDVYNNIDNPATSGGVYNYWDLKNDFCDFNSGIDAHQFQERFYEDENVTGEWVNYSNCPTGGSNGVDQGGQYPNHGYHYDKDEWGLWSSWNLLSIYGGNFMQDLDLCNGFTGEVNTDQDYEQFIGHHHLWTSPVLMKDKNEVPPSESQSSDVGKYYYVSPNGEEGKTSGQHIQAPDFSESTGQNDETAFDQPNGGGSRAGWTYVQRKFKPVDAEAMYSLYFTFDRGTTQQSDKNADIYIDNITFGEVLTTDNSRCYAGEYVSANPNWELDNRSTRAGSNVTLINTSTKNIEYTNTDEFSTPGKTTSKIVNTHNKALKTEDKFVNPVTTGGTTYTIVDTPVDSIISDNYEWSHKKVDNSWVPSMSFIDKFLANGSTHITGETSLKTNFEHSKYINGRMFVANVQITSDLGSEKHNDFVMYSQLGEPDVIPITNFIQIQDFEGSEILGLEEILGNLVVFVSKGVFLLQIPKDDPTSWSLLETEKTIGLSAPKSISKWEQFIFFAGHDNFYIIDKNFNATPISRSIKDDYMQYNNSETTSVVDIKNDRVLVQLGGLKGYIYSFDLKGFANNEEKWSRLDMQGQENVSAFVTDENYSVYTFLQKNSTNYTTITDVDGLKAYEIATAGGDGTAHIIIPRTQQTNALKDYQYIKIDGVLSGYQTFTHSSYYDDTLNYIVDKYTLTDDTSFDGVFTTFDTIVDDNEMIGADVNSDPQLINSKDTTIYNLIPSSGQTIETIKGTIKTGWMKFGDIDEKKTCRRFMIKYKASNPITAKIYIDGKSTAEKEITIPASANESMTSYRVGRSCKTIQLEVSSQNGMNQTFEIYRLELEIDE